MKKSNSIDYLIKHYHEVFDKIEDTEDEKFATFRNALVLIAAIAIFIIIMYGAVSLIFGL